MSRSRLIYSLAMGVLWMTIWQAAAQAEPETNRIDLVLTDTPQQAYTDLISSREDVPAVKAFLQRVQELEQLKSKVLKATTHLRGTMLDSLLAKSPNVPLPHDGLPIQIDPAGLNPLGLYWEMAETMSQGLDTQDLSPDEIEILRLEYNRVFHSLANEVWPAVRLPVLGETQSRTSAFEATMVFPLLETADADWTHETTAAFPAWALEIKALNQLKKVALRARRPFTSYQLSLYRHTNPQKPTREGYIKYLRNTALNASKAKDHATFMVCMRTAIEIAHEAKLSSNVHELTFQLAEGLGKMEQHAFAAEELNQMMAEEELGDETYVRALLLRLKYLYDGEQFDAIAEQLPVLRKDKRCQPYLPRIDYTLWIAHRRKGDVKEADRLQEQFLKDYPEHVLGADIYFSLAMTALASGSTDEAKQMLDVIQFNYPESRLIPRVTEIQKRLGD